MVRLGGRMALQIGVLWLAIPFLALPGIAQKDDAPSPGATHYIRNLGPFMIEGHAFTVRLSVICYKDTRHTGMCDEDDQETVKWMKILDENGKDRFSKSFTVAFAHQVERHVVEATLLEGRDHQALEIRYERLPSRANSGESIQVFAMRDGALAALNEEPLEYYGQLGELPPGTWKKISRRLLADDTFPIYELTSYFYVAVPVRLDWKDFRLVPQASGEFEVAQQPPFRRRPDIMADGYIHLYPSPDSTTTPVGINVTPKTSVEVLKARFAGAPDKHSSASDTWIEIRIDGKVGWILGVDEYTAVGLSFIK
jgi:hypothetical protein